MSEVKRPMLEYPMYDMAPQAEAYMNELEEIRAGYQDRVAELEAERDRLQECVDNRDHDLEVRGGHVEYEQGKVAELEARWTDLRERLQGDKKTLVETGHMGKAMGIQRALMHMDEALEDTHE